MSIKLLAPVHTKFGSTYFRLEVPSLFFGKTLEIDFYRYKIDKYKVLPFEVNNVGIQKGVGLAWDYLKWLEAFYLIMKQDAYDTLWLSRSLLNFDNILNRKIKHLIYDFDDAVWQGEAFHSFELFCRKASVVFAGNHFLAEHAMKFSDNVKIVPTSVNTEIYKRIDNNPHDTFNVGWIGSSSGFKYLIKIEKQLLTFFGRHNDARLLIVADRYPTELSQLNKFIDFTIWSINTDVEAINSFTVGIMPLDDGTWERGKCSFKMLQYMACEVPIIVSPVGMNKEVINFSQDEGVFGATTEEPDWVDTLDFFYQLSNMERGMQGQNGRRVVERNYSTAVISPLIEKYISDSF